MYTKLCYRFFKRYLYQNQTIKQLNNLHAICSKGHSFQLIFPHTSLSISSAGDSEPQAFALPSHTPAVLPVQQQFQHFFSGGEASVRGQEDADIGKVIVSKSRQQVLHKLLQGASFYGPDLTGLILTDCVSWRQLVPFNLYNKFTIVIRRNDSLEKKNENIEIVETRPAMFSPALISLRVRQGHPLTCECSRVNWGGGAGRLWAGDTSRSRGITSSWLHLLLFTILSRTRLLAYCIKHALYDPRIEFRNVMDHSLCIVPR